MTEYVDVRADLQKLQEDLAPSLRQLQKLSMLDSGWLALGSLPASAIKVRDDFDPEHVARADWVYGDSRTLQELQNDEPARCPACHQPISKVYCTPLTDTEVRLQLKRNGQSVYAGPCHRVNIL